MESRKRYFISQVLLFLLIVVAGIAVSRLTLEGLLLGSLIVIEASVEHPRLGALILLLFCFLSFLCFFDPKMGYRSGINLLRDGLVLLVSITVGILSFQLLAGGYVIVFVEPRAYDSERLREPFLQHPFLCSLNLLLFCTLCFAVIKMEYRRVMHIAGRVVVLLIIGIAWCFAAEFLWAGIASFAAGNFEASSIALPIFVLLLAFLCGGVVKYVFSLQAGYWTLFFANLAAVFVAVIDSLMRSDILFPYLLYILQS